MNVGPVHPVRVLLGWPLTMPEKLQLAVAPVSRPPLQVTISTLWML